MAIPHTHADILDKEGFAHVATIGPQGSPQSNPVWYDWDGKYLKISQTTTRQKYRNLQRDPRVAISITDPDNPYRYLEIRGRLDRVEDDDRNAFINVLAKKYLDQDVYPWAQPDEHRIVLFFSPERTTTMG
ncbi:MAG: TIGR03618 family F420-dependent PPOX class oxidoreductase [Streptosporangiales bacterium]|nr:TIGR03618 family F420-dependent PPOX class oxidoreductase [Streptosporangiales bacterium]